MLPQVRAWLGVCGKPSETKTKKYQKQSAVSKQRGAKRYLEGSVVSENGGANSKAPG